MARDGIEPPLAIDHPLTKEERHQLRASSSRAETTAFSFTNEYEWGNLKANPAKLLEQHFDVFVYVAHWGTHRLMLRLPAAALEDAVVSQYCVSSSVNASRVNDLWLLDLTYREDGGRLANSSRRMACTTGPGPGRLTLPGRCDQ